MKDRKFTVYRKLWALFFGALIPIVVINILMIQVANVRIRQQETEKMEVQLALKVASFDKELGRIASVLQFHVLDNEESFLAANYYLLTPFQVGQRVAELNDRINELSLMSDCIEEITIFMPNIERVISQQNYYDDKIGKSDMERISRYRYEDNGNVYSNGKLRVHMVAPTKEGKAPLYIMEAELSNAKILSFIREGGIEKYGLAGDNWVIREPMDYKIETAVGKIRQQTEEAGSFLMDDKLFCYHRMSLCDGWMFSYTELSNLLESVKVLHFFVIVTFFVTFFVVLLVSLLLTRSINRPFRQLLWLFSEVEKGKLDVKKDYRFKDEFAILFAQFDSMLLRIRELMVQGVEQEKELQKAEYRQLQAHIAPHFLYNSFNVLRHCILLEDYETADEMTRLLSSYFRYMTYGGEQETISLLEEWEHGSDYLEIQKIRFQDNIEIEMDELPEKYHNFRVPPFILQPLLGNIFKHGIKDMADTGQIRVKVKEQETEFCLIVWDNGSGVDFQKLEVVRKSIVGIKMIPGHLGLTNINKRLKILLGSNAGLSLNSEKDSYFEVVIHFPYKNDESEGEAKNDTYLGG